ncbi:restriction endonuclease subunit S [Chloroflexota bacterium]
MSKLEELIAELCPDGVEYTTLGAIGTFYGGLNGKSKDDFTDGNAKFITYMNVYSNLALDIKINDRVKIRENERQNTIQYGDILFTGSSETPDECGISSVLTREIDESLFLNSFCFGFRLNNTNLLLPGFSKYLFRSEELRKQIKRTANGVTRFNVSKKKMGEIKIPLPPLPVQQEIVRILDNFTELTTELAEELTARKKQYEYYRDELLTFRDEVPMMKLGEICEITRGRVISKSYLRDNAGEYPVYSSQTANDGIFGYIDNYDYNCESVTWTTDGANAGKAGKGKTGSYGMWGWFRALWI